MPKPTKATTKSGAKPAKTVTSRDELVHALIKKMMMTMRSLHAGHGYPFGEYKLGRPQVMLLFFISKTNDGAGTSVKELASFMNVTPGAITQFVNNLVTKKLVKRTEDPKDRRSIKITLTPSAQKKFEQFKKNYQKTVCPAFKALTQKELTQFIALFDKIKVA